MIKNILKTWLMLLSYVGGVVGAVFAVFAPAIWGFAHNHEIFGGIWLIAALSLGFSVVTELDSRGKL